MSKAVLVLNEMPEKCLVCPLCEVIEDYEQGYGFCMVRNMDQKIKFGTHENRPNWCPLQSFPQRRETDNMVAVMHDAELANRSTLQQIGYNKGWNDCMEEMGRNNGSD